jgi:hypothetical protein
VFASEHKRPKKITREVSAGGAIHSFSDEERQGYVEFINSTLKDDPDLQTTLPINPRNQDIFTAVSKGIVLWCAPIPARGIGAGARGQHSKVVGGGVHA